MRFKRLLALLLAAALALSLLAGCGGGQQSVSQVLLNLLDGQYQNVSVEIDSDLEAKLRQAISESETDEELRAALERLLGGGISFQRLGSGQQGDTAWDLIIYPGTDPNAAARSVYLDLDKVFAALPDDGLYSSGFAMAEMENGYALLVQATVDRAGSRDNDDDDEPEEPKEPYEVTMDKTGTVTDITVGTSEGLSQILSGIAAGGSEEEKNALTQAYNDGFEDVTIKLEPNTTYTVSDTFTITFKGILKGESESNKATINITDGNGLFQQIDSKGTVENITFDVQTEIKNTYSDRYVCAGAVAGYNYGEITNCDVTIGSSCTIKADSGTVTISAGGLVGENGGTITSCTVKGGAITATTDGTGSTSAGGLVGYNGGTITSCTVEGCTIKAEACKSNYSAFAGGLVGYNSGSGNVTGTWSGTGTITAKFGNDEVSVPDSTDPDDDENANTAQKLDNNNNICASAGTGIGYNHNGSNSNIPKGPVADDKLTPGP